MPVRTRSLFLTLMLAGCLGGVVRAQDPAVRISFRDEVVTDINGENAMFPLEVHFADEPLGHETLPAESYPSRVSHQPGRPHKPLKDRPGDISRKERPPQRYCLEDCERAGKPHEVAWWAKCAVNKRYSAWFVGGGTAWILPSKTRARSRDEGTWGLDHDGLYRPRRVWLNWSIDRSQGGLGAYETDRQPIFVGRAASLP